MKYIYILFTLWMLLFFQACSEDNLTPSEPYHTFAPEDSDTSEEAQLRREFYSNNGFYILFNDTLRRKLIGLDSQGDPVYQIETVDPGWSLFGYDGTTKYEFVYFKTITEKQQRAEFVAGLAKKMKGHNLTCPYSMLVVDTISVIKSDGSITHPDFLNSLRCFIIAVPELDQLNEMVLLANMAGSGIAIKYEDDLQDFYNLTVGMCGDLKFGRTVHSLIKAMSRYENINFIMISPEELRLPDYIIKDVFEKKNIKYKEVRTMEEVMPELDILYMTRVQKERFFNEADYIRLKDSFILDERKLLDAKEDLCIMHPLPRVNEISTKVDDDPRACYFKQALYGKYVRMALIMTLLGVSADENR